MNAKRRLLPVTLALAVGGCAVAPTPEAEAPAPPAEVRELAPPPPEEVEPPPVPVPAPAPVIPAPSVAPPPEVRRVLEYFRSLKKMGSVELAREHDNARTAFARTRAEYDRMRLALVVSLPDTPFNDEARALELLEPMTRNPQSLLHDLSVLIHAFVHEQRRLEQSLHGVQEKLDALKEMERNLIQREKARQIRR
jgi:hypothetical protein